MNTLPLLYQLLKSRFLAIGNFHVVGIIWHKIFSGYVSRGEVKTSTPKKSGAPSFETEMNCNERALVPVQKKPVACTNDNSR